MDYGEARKVMKKYDARIVTKTKSANGVAIKQESNGDWSMNVFVTKKRKSHRWLEKLELEGVPIKVKQVGKFRPLQSRMIKWRPAPGGVSIGHYNITAGTLGCLVYKGPSTYILSNNHVLADTNAGSIGDAIYQPGPGDGGGPADRIGVLDSYIPLVFNDPGNPNQVDAALCRPDSESDVSELLFELGTYSGQRTATVSEEVTKSGRTTAVTENSISYFSGLIVIDYWGSLAYFDDQIVTGSMSSPGDSGSLVIDKATQQAVGLIFAGNGAASIANRISDVVSALGITLYNEHREIIEAKYDL